MQVGDIDFLGRTLRVTRQLQRAKEGDVGSGKNLVEAAVKSTVMVRPPKYESERAIYLPDEVVAILAGHVRCNEKAEHSRAPLGDGRRQGASGRGGDGSHGAGFPRISGVVR